MMLSSEGAFSGLLPVLQILPSEPVRSHLVLLPVLLLLLLLVLLLITHAHWRRRARRAGYQTVRAYLRAAPRTDEEKRHAVELAVRGLAWCLLGILFPPLVLVGVVPLMYGTRKLCLAWLGVGIVDELDEIAE